MVTQGSSTSETGQARSWKKTGLIEECWTSTEVKPCALEMHARINTIQGRMHGILTCSLCSPTGHALLSMDRPVGGKLQTNML